MVQQLLGGFGPFNLFCKNVIGIYACITNGRTTRCQKKNQKKSTHRLSLEFHIR